MKVYLKGAVPKKLLCPGGIQIRSGHHRQAPQSEQVEDDGHELSLPGNWNALILERWYAGEILVTRGKRDV